MYAETYWFSYKLLFLKNSLTQSDRFVFMKIMYMEAFIRALSIGRLYIFQKEKIKLLFKIGVY